MLQALGLSYRVIDVAAGDLGSSAARKFDVEAWVPTQDTYRELTSTSNCTTYQARRLDIRYRTESGKTAPVATLNGTLATTRWIVALLETHQQADGSVVVPEALRPYLGGLERARDRPVTDDRRSAGSSPSTSTAPSLHEDGTISDAVIARGAAARRGRTRGDARHRPSAATPCPVLERLGISPRFVVCSNGAITLQPRLRMRRPATGASTSRRSTRPRC